MNRISLLLLTGSALLALDADYLGLDTHVSHQFVLSAGLSAGILDGDVPLPHPIVGTYSHDLDSDWQPGAALGLAWQRTTWNGDGDGWHLELGLSAERMNGHITQDSIGGSTNQADADVSLDGGLATFAAGWTWRWDGEDLRIAPGLWQLDLAPVVGLGVASVVVAGGNRSEVGPILSLGARARLTLAVGDGWRIGGQLGASWSEAHVRWSDTDEATFHGMGPTAALVLVLGR
jgi:hypothetical protein